MQITSPAQNRVPLGTRLTCTRATRIRYSPIIVALQLSSSPHAPHTGTRGCGFSMLAPHKRRGEAAVQALAPRRALRTWTSSDSCPARCAVLCPGAQCSFRRKRPHCNQSTSSPLHQPTIPLSPNAVNTQTPLTRHRPRPLESTPQSPFPTGAWRISAATFATSSPAAWSQSQNHLRTSKPPSIRHVPNTALGVAVAR